MADRLGENGAVRYAQDRWSFDNNDSRLGGAGHIASEIRRLAQEGKHTDYVSGLTVKGRLINRMIDVVYWPRKLFANNEVGTWYDPSDVNLTWRRNLLTYTEQFDNAAWLKTSATVTANTVVAPDGTMTADTLDITGSGGSIFQATTVTPNTQYTFSFYAKLGTQTQSSLAIYDQTNLTFIVSDFSYTANTSEYTRITYTFTTPAACTTIRVYPHRRSSAGLGTTYLWGAQVEANSYATDYQRIVTPEITYVADVQPQPILYQDSAGTTPVTAIEQPVGLMLDKSKGLAIGPELVTNGDFSDGLTGWTQSASATGIAVVVDGVLTYTSPHGDYAETKQLNVCTIGKWYKVEFDVVTAGTSANSIIINCGRAPLYTISGTAYSVGRKTGYALATHPDGFSISCRTDATIAIDNISVKEIAGNHAFQSTSTSRPVLRSRYNLLTYSEQFGNAAWLPVNATKTANALTAPNGTVTAGKLIANTASAVSHSLLITSGATLNVQYTYSVYVKESGYTNIQLFGDSSGNFTVTFNLITVTAAFGGDAISATITDVGDGWFRCTAVFTMKSNSRLNIQGFPTGATASNFGNTFTGDGTSGIYIWGADLRVTNDALNQPDYQRIAAATDYDTVGFLSYLQFDGTDDSMVTNSIDFTGTDKMTVWAGVRKLSDAATGAIFESSVSSSANNGAFIAYNEGASGKQGWGFNSRGTSAPSAAQVIAGYMAPITNILTGLGDIAGDSAVLRINATIVASSTADQGTGNYGNYPLYIGRRGGSTLPFNGRLYGLIVRGAQSTDSEITNTETWVNSRTGAYE